MKKTKKLTAIILGCILLVGSSFTAHATIYDDDIPSDGLHVYNKVGTANCTLCYGTNAALFKCINCPVYLNEWHYIIACGKCGFINDNP